MKFTWLIPLFFLSLSAFSQSNAPLGAGAKMIALGNTTSLSSGIYSIFGNQAGMTSSESFEAIINSGNYFFLSELRHLGFGALLPTQSGTFAISINQYGIKEFQEQKFGLGYARKFGKKISAGVQFDYFQIRTDEYGNKGALTFELGVQAEITKDWSIGVHTLSPSKISLTPRQNLPSIFKIGTSFTPSKNVTFLAEFEKDISFPIRLNSGIEYRLNERLYTRIGVRSNPTNFNFGIGSKITKKIAFDIAFSYHQILGFSPLLSVKFNSSTK